MKYALIRNGAVIEEREYAAPLDPAGIKRDGGQLVLVAADGTRRPIGEEERARVVAPYRVTSRVEGEGEEARTITMLDGIDQPDGLPAGTLVGELDYEGGLPVLRPIVEIKPELAEGEQLTDVTVVIFDDRVEHRHAKGPKRFQRKMIAKLQIVERLDEMGLLDHALDAIEADRKTKARWDAAVEIANDDPTALALLAAIGADPAVILA